MYLQAPLFDSESGFTLASSSDGKVCNTCQRLKEWKGFGRDRNGPAGSVNFQARCRECQKAHGEAQRQARRSGVEAHLYELQQGRCGNQQCLKPINKVSGLNPLAQADRKACFDMKVTALAHAPWVEFNARGLLCNRCNVFLAALENPHLAEGLRDYIDNPPVMEVIF